MQYSLSKLNPATLQTLKDSLDEPLHVQTFLEKLRKFLGGEGKSVAEQDLAFSTASELSASGIVDFLPINEIADILSKTEESKALAFKTGLAPRYRATLDQLAKETVVKRPAKKLAGTMKLQIPAGQANPSPPVGPALGRRGINIMEFCKAFNAKTAELEPGAPCPTVISYYQDKSFTLNIKTPPASYYLKKAAKLRSGANKPGRETIGTVTAAQVREIAEAKMRDLSVDIDAAMRDVLKDAEALGISIKRQ